MNLRPVIAAFGIAEGQLAVGGMPLDRLTARVGSTPYFAYDRRLLSERVAALRATLPSAIHLSYAVKANPMPAVVQHLAGLVDALDVASTLEMRTALDTPLSADRISFAGPGKTVAEIAQAVAAGVTIEMESSTEARRVIEAGEMLGVRPRVAVRVNPDFQVKGSGMRMGGGPQQFGVDAEQVPELLALVATADLDFLGFHVFAGSQNLNAEILCEAQQKTVELILGLADKSPAPVRYVNLGGGFGIPYFDKDSPLDLGVIGTNLTMLVQDRIQPELPDTKVVIELGRYIVGESGVYVTRIVDRKVSRGRTYLVVDGGMHHQLAASGNFGQVIRRNYPIAVGNRLTEAPQSEVTVVGCLCTPLDLLGDGVVLPDAEIGDSIVLFQAGAYGLTASPTAFLGHPAPIEVLV
ncbi:pyridoxal-dependent decarboxylase, exosortase A system-associated [Mycolicibacterium vaccae]|uniref:pyridoxal-dependent decarboxylase, exosortase A system-associated n=1 Tax=Mycolicibacterium vaccae TaxID=1810 RepID=UPI00058FE92A|nr:pyridoxal-dependent decarboxylase, exosortase A system-associated [Mycolicibacterium vaccae]